MKTRMELIDALEAAATYSVSLPPDHMVSCHAIKATVDITAIISQLQNEPDSGIEYVADNPEWVVMLDDGNGYRIYVLDDPTNDITDAASAVIAWTGDNEAAIDPDSVCVDLIRQARLESSLSQAAAVMGRKGGSIGGKSTSPAKQQASRENGKLGGRPKTKLLTWHNHYHNTTGAVKVSATADITDFASLQVDYPKQAKSLKQQLCGIHNCKCEGQIQQVR